MMFCYKFYTFCAINFNFAYKKYIPNVLYFYFTYQSKVPVSTLSEIDEKIKSCIKLTGFVNSTEDFIEQPKVINGASDTIVKIFGNAGMHTRAAVSTNSLPLGVAVEVDAIFELN